MIFCGQLWKDWRQQVAYALGLSKPHVCNVVRGERPLTLRLISALRAHERARYLAITEQRARAMKRFDEAEADVRNGMSLLNALEAEARRLMAQRTPRGRRLMERRARTPE